MISELNMNPSAVPPSFPILLTLTPVATVAGPWTILEGNFSLRLEGLVMMRQSMMWSQLV
jgi:hypothetical protein